MCRKSAATASAASASWRLLELGDDRHHGLHQPGRCAWPGWWASVSALLSFSYGAYLVVDYLLHGNEASGWTTIVTALLFFAGVNLISLGVMGEYVARIFDEVKGRPLFVTRQRRDRARQARSVHTQ